MAVAAAVAAVDQERRAIAVAPALVLRLALNAAPQPVVLMPQLSPLPAAAKGVAAAAASDWSLYRSTQYATQQYRVVPAMCLAVAAQGMGGRPTRHLQSMRAHAGQQGSNTQLAAHNLRACQPAGNTGAIVWAGACGTRWQGAMWSTHTPAVCTTGMSERQHGDIRRWPLVVVVVVHTAYSDTNGQYQKHNPPDAG